MNNKDKRTPTDPNLKKAMSKMSTKAIGNALTEVPETMNAVEFAKSEGFFDSPHFPMMHVSGLMERYANYKSQSSKEKEELKQYVIHKASCAWSKDILSSTKTPCTCGLEKLLSKQ